MKIEIEVPDEMISNLLCSAFEGGSNYWLRSTKCEMNGDPVRADRTTLPLENGGVVICTLDDEIVAGGGTVFRLDRKSIERGILAMREKASKHFGDALAENDDATTGDTFLQMALFGEVVFA